MTVPKIPPERFLGILNEVDTGVYFLDLDRCISFWNDAAERISGYAAADVVGTSCADDILIHVDDQGTSLCKNGCPAERTMLTGESIEADVYLHHREGHRVPVRIRTSPLHGRDGEIVGAVETFADTSAATMKARVDELERLVLLDEVTRVGNRRFGERTIAARLAQLQRYRAGFGLLFVDVDHFKSVNDNRGHDIGDHALRLVSATLSGNLRPFDEISRWGGDEFVVVCPNVDLDLLASLAERLRTLVEASVVAHDGWVMAATVSVGVTLARAEDTIESLVARADAAMYQAKGDGSNRVVVS